MPGSLYGGYLQREARYQEEQEQAEEKKRAKLQESLQKLNMEKLRRDIERDAREWQIKVGAQKQLSQILSTLDLEELKQYYTGIKPKGEEYPYTVSGDVLYHKGTGEYKTLPQIQDPSAFDEAVQNIYEYLGMPGKEYTAPESPAILKKQATEMVLKQKLPRVFGEEKGSTRTTALANAYSSHLARHGLTPDELSIDEWYEQMGIGKPIGGEGVETPSTEEGDTFYGASNYKELLEGVRGVPEPKRSQILAEGRQFFGME